MLHTLRLSRRWILVWGTCFHRPVIHLYRDQGPQEPIAVWPPQSR